MKLFSTTFDALEQGLNYSSLKQKTIADNIANVDTPNYKAKNVSFKGELDRALNESLKAHRTNPRHFEFTPSSSFSNSAIVSRANDYQQNGNSVDMDLEMSEIAKNQIYYQALSDRLSGKFSSMKMVIGGGR
ncbi:flagellar basal body rod protein FlgB [Priestia koreensis]|uniref:flagellar basal body rod protein FlgB n=1 Tax=Priestia koreensis TaxID=284581 RepID=UPI0028F71631|nr:flagellar basal body rod protein FlgB [Priestia koreensis]